VKFDTPLATATAVLAALALTSCQAKEESKPADQGKGAPAEITVTASDSACELSGNEGATGANTFVITNNGDKVTEFYVYGEGERVMGEVENISPGLQRKLIVQLNEPGTYQTACKPGMVGDGLRADFKVTGESVNVDDEGKFKEASDNYERYVNSQTDALIAATQIFVDAVKKGDVNAAKAQFPVARTYYERIEPVAESFPDDLDPRRNFRCARFRAGATTLIEETGWQPHMLVARSHRSIDSRQGVDARRRSEPPDISNASRGASCSAGSASCSAGRSSRTLQIVGQCPARCGLLGIAGLREWTQYQPEWCIFPPDHTDVAIWHLVRPHRNKQYPHVGSRDRHRLLRPSHRTRRGARGLRLDADPGSGFATPAGILAANARNCSTVARRERNWGDCSASSQRRTTAIARPYSPMGG